MACDRLTNILLRYFNDIVLSHYASTFNLPNKIAKNKKMLFKSDQNY